MISGKAKSCPVCGDPKKEYIGAAFYIGLLVLIFLGVKSCIGGSLDRAEKLGSSEQYQAPKEGSSLATPDRTHSAIAEWKKNPALPKDFNAQELKESGKKVCNKAVSEKTASDFYEDCYKYILLSIKRIEQLNYQNLDSDYVKYIYPSCVHAGTGGKWVGDPKAVNANIVKICLNTQMNYLKWFKWYEDRFGKDEVLTIKNKHREDFYSEGSWFSAYGELYKAYGPPKD